MLFVARLSAAFKGGLSWCIRDDLQSGVRRWWESSFQLMLSILNQTTSPRRFLLCLVRKHKQWCLLMQSTTCLKQIREKIKNEFSLFRELTLFWSKLLKRLEPMEQAFLDQCRQMSLFSKTVYHILFLIKVVQSEVGWKLAFMVAVKPEKVFNMFTFLSVIVWLSQLRAVRFLNINTLEEVGMAEHLLLFMDQKWSEDLVDPPLVVVLWINKITAMFLPVPPLFLPGRCSCSVLVLVNAFLQTTYLLSKSC